MTGTLFEQFSRDDANFGDLTHKDGTTATQFPLGGVDSAGTVYEVLFEQDEEVIVDVEDFDEDIKATGVIVVPHDVTGPSVEDVWEIDGIRWFVLRIESESPQIQMRIATVQVRATDPGNSRYDKGVV